MQLGQRGRTRAWLPMPPQAAMALQGMPAAPAAAAAAAAGSSAAAAAGPGTVAVVAFGHKDSRLIIITIDTINFSMVTVITTSRKIGHVATCAMLQRFFWKW